MAKLLKDTSRSFYLTLRVLPRKVRPQIGLAYLLARTTDTIADTGIVPVEKRLSALRELRGRISGVSRATLNFGELAQQQGSPTERILLERVEESLAELQSLAAEDQKLVREVLGIITSGQELDLQRFASASGENIIELKNDAELHDYTYRVAGCVGEFWTSICLQHLFRLPELEDSASPSFKELGVQFGKGLQLVNILRDLPVDLRKGRCYLPTDQLATVRLRSTDLLSAENEPKFRALYNAYLDLAESNLAAGWKYTNLIPFAWMSLRLACAWPILIGAKTLARLRVTKVLDPEQRVKISRAEVRGLIARSILFYPLPSVWRRLATLPAGKSGKAVASSGNLT